MNKVLHVLICAVVFIGVVRAEDQIMLADTVGKSDVIVVGTPVEIISTEGGRVFVVVVHDVLGGKGGVNSIKLIVLPKADGENQPPELNTDGKYLFFLKIKEYNREGNPTICEFATNWRSAICLEADTESTNKFFLSIGISPAKQQDYFLTLMRTYCLGLIKGTTKSDKERMKRKLESASALAKYLNESAQFSGAVENPSGR